jgi:CheY-like chemotaxis protein
MSRPLPNFDTTQPLSLDGGAAEGVDLDLDLDVDLDLGASLSPGAPLVVEGAAAVGPSSTVAGVAGEGLVRVAPMVRTQTLSRRARRVLVVSADSEERVYLRSRLALSRLVWVDEAATTTQALSAMADLSHVLVFINLDAVIVDGWLLAHQFRQTHPKLHLVATTSAVEVGHPWWHLHQLWRAWYWQRKIRQAGFDELLCKPISGRQVADLAHRFSPTDF